MPLHPQASILRFRQHGSGSGVLQSVSVDGSHHVIKAEGHPSLGGTDSAPSPLDLVLAGLASCNQVTSFIVARELGLEFKRFDVEVTATLDTSVLAFGVEGDGNFSTVDLTIEVETDADPALFERFAKDVERRCPVTQLFVKSGVAVAAHWVRRTGAAAAKVA